MEVYFYETLLSVMQIETTVHFLFFRWNVITFTKHGVVFLPTKRSEGVIEENNRIKLLQREMKG